MPENKLTSQPLRILPADEAQTIGEMPLVGAQHAPVQAPAKFVAIHRGIMQGSRCVGWATSKTMAKRMANALNKHVPNAEGV